MNDKVFLRGTKTKKSKYRIESIKPKCKGLYATRIFVSIVVKTSNGKISRILHDLDRTKIGITKSAMS